MQKTLVTFLLDRSGSMAEIKGDTIGGFNTFLEGLQKGDAADNTEFTLVQFDTQGLDKVHFNKAVKDVPNLTEDTFIPRGGTPLIDAAYTTVEAVAEAVEGSDKKVVICIQTDGEENSSTEHNWNQLKVLIETKQGLGWQFNFFGVGIDAYVQGAAMGISKGSTISTTRGGVGMATAYASASANTASYASGVTQSTRYTAEQKFASGDVYDPDLKKPAEPSVKSKSEAKQQAATK